MADNFTPTPVKGRKASGVEVPTDDNVGVLPVLATAAPQTLAEGTVAYLSANLDGALRVILAGDTEAGDNLIDVDVSDRQERILGLVRLDEDTRAFKTDLRDGLRDALLGGLESVSLNADTRDDLVTRLTTALEDVGLNAPTRDDIVARLTTAIVDLRDTLTGNLEAVSLNADTRDDLVGRLSAALVDVRDVLSTSLESVSLNDPTLTALTTNNPYVRGAAVDDANPFPVVMQSEPGTIVDTGLLTVDNLAAGAEALLAAPAVAGGGRLLELTAAASVRIRVELRAVNGGTADRRLRVFFVEANEHLVYRPADRDVARLGDGGHFTLAVTNMDNVSAANVYGSVTQIEG